MCVCRKGTASPYWNGYARKEGYPIHHHNRICISFGCGTYYQTGCNRLPAQTGTQGASAGIGRGCVPAYGYGTEEGEGAVSPDKSENRTGGKYARLVAPSEMAVMILGANGTGKESVAQSIHQGSERWNKPFVAVNCGALPRELAASLLFGHEKGAFTGADTAKAGYFDMAKGGTLFLDEIGTMSFEIQSMLLRVLQESTYTPIGSSKERIADVRIVSATNEDLQQAIKEGRFREDLYHRLNEFEIQQPSLAECPEDILPLAEFFRERYSKELKRETSGFPMMPEARCLPILGRVTCVKCKTG